MMVGPVMLLMHLGWCTHIDSWDVVSWFAYISDFESWSAFVWSIVLVLLCQHSFGDVWSCFSIGSLRLCISFSLHHHWAYLIVSYLVTFYVLCWSLSYTRAYPHIWVHRMFYRFFSLLDLFLDLYGSSHWGISPSLSPPDLLCTFSLLDLFLDLCESSYRGIPPLALFLMGHSPLFGFAMSRADFMVVRPICRSLRVIT